MIPNKEGNPKSIIRNAIVALSRDQAFENTVGRDMLRDETMVLAALPWSGNGHAFPRAWNDNDDRMCACWLQEQGVIIGVPMVAEAMQAVAALSPYHPVIDYLKRTEWDGIHRVEDVPVKFLGCEPSDYAGQVFLKWMISGVARVCQPGVKADCALVLEGPQGLGKSSALKALSSPWFTDEIAALGTKDAAEQTLGIWVVELAELDALIRASDIAAAKAFMSRSTDRFRMSYGRRVAEHPRQCIFAATSNRGD